MVKLLGRYRAGLSISALGEGGGGGPEVVRFASRYIKQFILHRGSIRARSLRFGRLRRHLVKIIVHASICKATRNDRSRLGDHIAWSFAESSDTKHCPSTYQCVAGLMNLFGELKIHVKRYP